MAELSLSNRLTEARDAAGLSRRALAKLATCDPATISALENGGGTLASLRQVALALSLKPSPYPSALANKRRWLGIGTRKLSSLAGISRPVLQSLEATGEARVATFEAFTAALGEAPRLIKIEPTWATPQHIVGAVLCGLGRAHFDVDPASPVTPCVPCARWYTERDGGLWHEWRGTIWVNPPYDSNELPRWIDKAIGEHQARRAARIIMLVPFAPNTSAWWVLVQSGAALFVLKDRLRFGGRRENARLPSAIVALGLPETDLGALALALPSHHRVTGAVLVGI